MIKIKNYEVIKAFGKRLRDLRTSQNLSQEELANLADIPLSQIGRIGRGEVNCTISTLYSISKALNQSMEKLVSTIS